MKNIPKKIYLQIGGCSPHPDEDFGELRKSGEITWNDERLHEDDIEYRLAADTFTKESGNKAVYARIETGQDCDGGWAKGHAYFSKCPIKTIAEVISSNLWSDGIVYSVVRIKDAPDTLKIEEQGDPITEDDEVIEALAGKWMFDMSWDDYYRDFYENCTK